MMRHDARPGIMTAQAERENETDAHATMPSYRRLPACLPGMMG